MYIDDDVALAYLDALRNAITRRRELEALIETIGAQQLGSQWFLPFYMAEAPHVMLPVERWIDARKRAAQGLDPFPMGDQSLPMAPAADCDTTLSDGLPDKEGQALSD